MPVYWDAGPDGAVVANLLSDTQATLPKEQWDKERFGMGCIAQSDFGWLKATLEKLCGEMPKLCTYETKQAMKKFFARSEQISSKLRR